jgi:hypothetical protein
MQLFQPKGINPAKIIPVRTFSRRVPFRFPRPPVEAAWRAQKIRGNSGIRRRFNVRRLRARIGAFVFFNLGFEISGFLDQKGREFRIVG